MSPVVDFLVHPPRTDSEQLQLYYCFYKIIDGNGVSRHQDISAYLGISGIKRERDVNE